MCLKRLITYMWKLIKLPEALKQLGSRLREVRLSQGLTQRELAALAGVARNSVARLEDSGSGRTDTLLRVLGALNILDRLDAVLPEATPSPLAMLKRSASLKPRLRVRHKRKR
ncbi:transcriptional regulator, XRE family [mine drainage metagenome]|uniref:Transcriptional regulator, XRE family n=1 Tax=mine drainage metagenome TaxID=410659 RepID=T1D4N2_9ZZZZ